MMENDTLVYIMEHAALKEEIAYRLYIGLSESAKSDAAKSLFLNLADEELVHQRLIKKADLRRLKIVNSSPLGSLNLLRDVDMSSVKLDDYDEIIKAIDLAIDEEKKAYDDYSIMIRHMDSGDFKETLEEIAEQEVRHQRLLERFKSDMKREDFF